MSVGGTYKMKAYFRKHIRASLKSQSHGYEQRPQDRQNVYATSAHVTQVKQPIILVEKRVCAWILPYVIEVRRLAAIGNTHTLHPSQPAVSLYSTNSIGFVDPHQP